MRAVLDTNVLLSGLLWHGAPHALLKRVRDSALTLISSPALLAELAEILDPPPLSQPVCRDPDDDALLALAIAAQADLIVSGDKDLLALGSYDAIPILTPAQALQRIAVR